MDERRNARRYVLVLVAVVGLLVSAAGVIAVAQPDDGEVFTGCVNQNSGILKNVAIGLEPTKPCNDEEVQVTWDRAGPAFEARITALEERVAELEAPFGVLELFVDCAAGDSVGAALADAQDHPGPVNIIISGVCEENVGIDRDDVNLFGLQRSDGIRAASAGSTVSIGDAQRVRFFNMTITGGSAGIDGQPGASFFVDGVTVRDASVWGILASPGSSAELRDCIVETTSSGAGVTANGGDVSINGCLITGNSEDGLKSEFGGRIIAFTVDATGNGGHGAVAQVGASIWLVDSTIADNVFSGINAISNSTIAVGGSLISNNGADGASAGVGGLIDIGGNSVVEANGGSGISADQASTVFIQETTITANTFDGVVLRDQSNGASGGAGIVITDNGGFGINCAGPPGFPVVQNGFDVAQIQFSGNTNGDTNCP